MESDPKGALRRHLLAARRALSAEERAAHSLAIAARIATLPAWTAARTVACYAPMGAEADLTLLARAAREAGKQVVWPRVLPGRRDLSFAAAAPEALLPGPFGTRQPPLDAPEIATAAIDLVLVPGVGFDAAGRRLGRGGGYYDATLPALAPGARTIGVAFECQLADRIPAAPHDAAVECVVTEDRLVPAARAPTAG